jgi:magnesium transporter
MVDAFVPLLRKIDKEVEGVDALITNPQNSLESVPPSEITIQGESSDAIEEKIQEPQKNEKPGLQISYPRFRSRFRSRIKSWKTRIWLLVPKKLRFGQEKVVVVEPPTKLATFQTLLRMANTRRLVTSLVRLLATKSEVIGQLRKRLQGGAGGAVDWDEGDMARGQEVGIYLGDVQGMSCTAS